MCYTISMIHHVKKLLKRTKKRVVSDAERDARKGMLEDLFHDFYANRWRIYRVNFVRGLFFGLGSVLGGTVVVAFIVWLLSVTGSFVPVLNDITDTIINNIQSKQ